MSVTDGVNYTVLGREWRCKWSEDDDKASLKALQALNDTYVPAVKAMAGFQGATRTVCGGCKDFKLQFRFAAADLIDLPGVAEWLAAAGSIPGVSECATQTYTLAEL